MDMESRRDSMWRLMMQNGQRAESGPNSFRSAKDHEIKIQSVPSIAKPPRNPLETPPKKPLIIDTAINATANLMGDMFVRHHSPKYSAKNLLLDGSKSKKPSLTTDDTDLELSSPSKRKRKREQIKVPSSAPEAVSRSLIEGQKDGDSKVSANPFANIKGIKGAAFLLLMRAKLRLKQKKALQKLKKEVLGIYTENTPSIVHPDEFLRPISHESPANAKQISQCLRVFGRKRMRILTYIFKHIDYNKIGEISFDCVMQFDLLLMPQATRQMLFEDANLFFEFSGKKQRPLMNMLDWLVTWKLAKQKTGSFKVIDNFLDQYFETFREAKFRLNIIGIAWP